MGPISAEGSVRPNLRFGSVRLLPNGFGVRSITTYNPLGKSSESLKLLTCYWHTVISVYHGMVTIYKLVVGQEANPKPHEDSSKLRVYPFCKSGRAVESELLQLSFTRQGRQAICTISCFVIHGKTGITLVLQNWTLDLEFRNILPRK